MQEISALRLIESRASGIRVYEVMGQTPGEFLAGDCGSGGVFCVRGQLV